MKVIVSPKLNRIVKVKQVAPSSGGSGAWGGITGTLADQVDLAGVLAAQTAVHADTKEPTGFVDPDNISRSYDSATRKVTLTAITGTLDYYWRGVKKTLGATWTSSAHDDVAGSWFLSSSDGTNFVWSNTPWLFSYVMTAFISYGVADKFGISETHGCTMSAADHEEDHDNIGTYKKSGGGVSGYALASTTAADRRPLVASTTVKDEDLKTVLAELATESYTQFSLTSANTAVFTKAAADIIALSTNRPYYNQLTGGAWQQTLMSANSYTCVWLVAVPVTEDSGSQAYRYLWVQGQTEGNLTSQQARTPANVSFGAFQTLATEFVFIGKVILQYVASSWVLTSVELLAGTKSGQSSTPAASYVSQTVTAGNLLTAPSEDAVAAALAGKLDALASVNTQTGTTYTILASDLGKDVRFTSGTAVTLTLPAYTGFSEGFQCTLHNDSASAIDVTFSGTVVASGTKIAQKKSALLRMVGASWRCSGGVS